MEIDDNNSAQCICVFHQYFLFQARLRIHLYKLLKAMIILSFLVSHMLQAKV